LTVDAYDREMDWDDLRYVLAIARTGSLGDAARSLGVAHSTVYRRLTAFEEGHGVRVFDRLPEGYSLTEAGRDLVASAEGVERQISEAERRLVGKDTELKGEVSLAAPEALGESICALLPELMTLHPQIVVRLTVSADMADLSRREADLAIRAMAKPPESLFGKKLADVAFAVYGRRDLAEHEEDARWVTFDDSLAHTPQGRWEAKHVTASRVRARLGSRALFVSAVRAGVGVGILPCGLGDQEPSLRRVGAPIPELTAPLWLLTHDDLRDVPRVRAVMDFLGARLGKEKALMEGG
jgi:DNA-binding transcriptional LysR family regulator